MPGGRAALPLGGGVVGVIVTLAIVLLGGGGYDVGRPFEQFPSQPRPGEDRNVMRDAPDAQSKLVAFVRFVTATVTENRSPRTQIFVVR